MRLALMRSAWSSSSEGSLPELASGLAELLPGLGDELGEHLRGRSLGARQQARLVGRLHEPVEQVEVAVARERPVQAGQALPPLRGQVPQQPLALGGVGRAHGAEVASGSGARGRRRRARRRGRRRARPARCATPRPTRRRARPRRSAGRCAADGCSPGPGGHRGCRGRAGRSGRGPGGAAPRRRWPAARPRPWWVRAERFGRGIGGRQRRRSQCPDQLGRGVGRPGPGPPQRVDHRVQQAVGRSGHGLDLELAEAGRHPLALEHGDLVVAHLGEGSAPAVAQHHDAAIALEAGDGLQRRPSQQARARRRPARRGPSPAGASTSISVRSIAPPPALELGTFSVQRPPSPPSPSRWRNVTFERMRRRSAAS